MDNKIKEILEDLYKIDGSLKEHAGELEKTVEAILKSRPNISIDEKFKKELYRKIMLIVKESPAEKPRFRFAIPAFFYGRYGYAFAGAALMLVVAVGLTLVVTKSGYFQIGITSPLEDFTFTKSNAGHNAFGTLGSGSNGDAVATKESVTDEEGSQTASMPAVAPSALYGRGGGGMSNTANIGMDSVGMPVKMRTIKYVYKGEALDLNDKTVEVLRRKGISEDPSRFGNLLSRAGMGLVNLFSFAPLQIETINFKDTRDFGYMVSVNMRDGNIEIGQNSNWVYATTRCTDARCYEENRMKIEDMPSDAEMIALANDFMKKHGINLANFGDPAVDSMWRAEYARAAVKTDAWVPESVSVTYPMKVNGTQVYDLSGNKTSVIVNVNAREKKVAGMYNLWAQNYDASDYDAITDPAKVLEVAVRGGYYGSVSSYNAREGVEVETVEAELGTPVKVYTQMTNYTENSYNNLLVPALWFPVTNIPTGDDLSFPAGILVPLAKDLISYPAVDDMPVRIMKGTSTVMPSSQGSMPSPDGEE
jgi:hypothetical protein